LHDYVAAIEALHIVCPSGKKGIEKEIMARVRQEGFDDAAIAASRTRFLRALDYWRAEGET
jgi:hypothetical protein